MLQEVKTTTQDDLDYAGKLIADYDKLFGTTPSFKLQTKLQQLKNKLEYEHGRKDLCSRIDQISGISPGTATKVRLVPTVVYDTEVENADAKMLAIRRTLVGKGWASESVTAWAVGLSELEKRLIRLAQGKN